MSAFAMVSENEYGTVTEIDTVRFERMLPGPIERVWSYLTDPEKRATWFAGGEMELRAGGKVQLVFNHADLTTPSDPIPDKYKKKTECGAEKSGRILRCEPPRLLAFTWSDPRVPDSEVTFELAPLGKEVLLRLTHRKLDRTIMRNVAPGWHTHLGLLEDRLSGAALRPLWATLTKLEGEYEKLL
jgi:uncharacterized protein YndB with AHSA1/START domain